MRAIRTLSVPSLLATSLALAATLAASLPAAARTLAPTSQGHPAHRLSQRVRYGAPASLVLPQSNAFAILGHSCGGIGEHPYMTGFDPASGYPTGAVHLSTTCSTGGRGGHTVTYTAWAGVTWDFAGHVVSAARLSTDPTVDPTFNAADAYEDIVFNTGGAAYLLVPFARAPAGVTAVQAGDLFQVSWSPTAVNPAVITSTTLTATPVNSTAPVLTTTVTGSASNGTLSPLQPSTTYLITAESTTLSGPGPECDPISVTTSPPTEPPGAPTGVTAYWTNQDPTGSTDTIIVTWNAADPGDSPIDQYVVRARNSETGVTDTQTVSGTTLTASFTEDWVPNWDITVQAHNAFGWGPVSDVFRLGGL